MHPLQTYCAHTADRVNRAQSQCKDKSKFVANVASARKDPLALVAPEIPPRAAPYAAEMPDCSDRESLQRRTVALPGYQLSHRTRPPMVPTRSPWTQCTTPQKTHPACDALRGAQQHLNIMSGLLQCRMHMPPKNQRLRIIFREQLKPACTYQRR